MSEEVPGPPAPEAPAPEAVEPEAPAPEAVEPKREAPEAARLEEAPLQDPCAACGAPLAGAYCHVCGERRARPEDESLGHFLREQFQEVTSADGRMWRTVRALFVPGKLTTEYFAGRRGLYLRPVRIFLVANVFFFLLLSLGGANSIFQGRVSSYRADTSLADRLDAGAAEAGVEAETFDAAFDQRSGTLANSLPVLLVPMFAFLLGVALIWRRVSAVRHLVFATHYLAVAMAGSITVALALIPVQLALGASGWLPPGHWFFSTLDPIIGLVLLTYLLVAIRRVYRLGWATATAVTAAVAFFGVPLIVGLYRDALFWLTLWTVTVPV
ncbi:MAG: DUF3667 domain-containing protein [Bacteroidota bacterium]